jgi:hypothetical protein
LLESVVGVGVGVVVVVVGVGIVVFGVGIVGGVVLVAGLHWAVAEGSVVWSLAPLAGLDCVLASEEGCGEGERLPLPPPVGSLASSTCTDAEQPTRPRLDCDFDKKEGDSAIEGREVGSAGLDRSLGEGAARVSETCLEGSLEAGLLGDARQEGTCRLMRPGFDWYLFPESESLESREASPGPADCDFGDVPESEILVGRGLDLYFFLRLGLPMCFLGLDFVFGGEVRSLGSSILGFEFRNSGKVPLGSSTLDPTESVSGLPSSLERGGRWFSILNRLGSSGIDPESVSPDRPRISEPEGSSEKTSFGRLNDLGFSPDPWDNARVRV